MGNNINVRDRNFELSVSVDAVAFSIDRTFALHRDAGFEDGSKGWGWTVSHMPTGLGVFVGVRRRKDAEKAMEALVERFGTFFRKIRFTSGMKKGNVAPSVKAMRVAVGAVRPAQHVVPSYWRDVPSELVSS